LTNLLGLKREHAEVQEKRDSVLSARGLLEITFQFGVQQRSRLANGKYIASLQFGQDSGLEIGRDSSALLRQAIEAVEFADAQLSSALAALNSLDPDINVSEDGKALIATETKDCADRQKFIAKTVGDWHAALEEYDRWWSKPRKPL
jgi:hypothetical protein